MKFGAMAMWEQGRVALSMQGISVPDFDDLPDELKGALIDVARASIDVVRGIVLAVAKK